MLTTWKEWRTRYPNTQVMKPMPGYLERFALLRSRVARSRPRELVAGLAVGNETMAFQIAALRTTPVVNERLGGVPIVVIHQLAAETTTAYDARVKDRGLPARGCSAHRLQSLMDATEDPWSSGLGRRRC